MIIEMLGKPKIAISILRKLKVLKRNNWKKIPALEKGFYWRHLATYLGDVEAYEESDFICKKKMKKNFEMAEVQKELAVRYMSWHGMEKKKDK